MYRLWLVTGSISMLAALAIAAATGHGLKGEFVPVVRQVLDTAREMHFVHSLALLAVGIISAQFGRKLLIDLAGVAFLAGILLFCGGIYAAYGPQAAAAKPLIPLGGASFMLGWILFAAGAFLLRRNAP